MSSECYIPFILTTEPRTIPALNEFCIQFDRFVLRHRGRPTIVESIEKIIVSIPSIPVPASC